MAVTAIFWHSLPIIKIMPSVKTTYIKIQDQQLNRSSDVHEIQQTSFFYKRLYSKCKFHENWLSESHTVHMGIYTFLSTLSTFIVQFQEILDKGSAHNEAEQMRVS
jgi:hypothetical protein